MANNTAEQLLTTMGGFHAACILGAAAELDVFTALSGGPRSAAELAQQLKSSERGMTMLLDALVGIELLKKEDGRYLLPPELAELLVETSPRAVLPMIRHQMTCLRAWSELAKVVRKGVPAKRRPSIRGAKADRAAFLLAMDNVSAPMAPGILAKLQPLNFKHLLDVGGASGTWTLAFLRAVPNSKATLFDLPDAIPHAKKRMKQNGMTDRVTLVAGDFYKDELPKGADYAWVSAIIHQNSREQNRDLFAKVCRALEPGGRIVIRDVVMSPDKTGPRGGVLFAINMLVNTPSGGTFSLAEMDEDLRHAGFSPAQQLLSDPWMNSVVQARKQ